MTTTRETEHRAHYSAENSRERGERGEAVHERVDFKMVTFSLGGKDYGIDIMRVKEIAKFLHFTYVPNTAPYVRGVYNLRGDIISVIDLRLLFNLPAEQKATNVPENGLILRLESTMLGVIVDSIDRVVGLSSHQIQPPHPIFGDVNIQFISGVAEHESRLYIILDVDRIFQRDEEKRVGSDHDDVELPESDRIPRSSPRETQEGPGDTPPSSLMDKPADLTVPPPESEGQLNRSFIQEGLVTFSGFYYSRINSRWFERRLDAWGAESGRTGKDLQLKEPKDAQAFLAPFFSRCTDRVWDNELAQAFNTNTPDLENSVVNVWNPGCGGGRESYSLALTLKERYPGKQIKIWAGDTDLLKISNAPNLILSREEIPARWGDYLVETKAGLTFTQAVKDMIVFEFSDMVNGVMLPKMDCIVCRDVLSFQPPEVQEQSFQVFKDVVKPSGILVLGDNEEPADGSSWEPLDDSISMYRHK